MTQSSSILNTLLTRTGCGYLLVDAELRILEASDTITRFGAHDAALAGRLLAAEFPEFKDYVDQFGKLMDDPEAKIRFRIKREENVYVLVSVQRTELDVPALLVLFEDITQLVLRTEILGRRVKELESRCQTLEKALPAAAALEPLLDPDTGLYDLDSIIGRLTDEEAFSRRWKKPFSVLVIRVNDLADLVDRYHLSTEQAKVLFKALADTIRLYLRTMDILGRVDESGIIALLPHTSKEGAQISAERILAVTQDQHFNHIGKLKLDIGLSELELDGDDTALKMFERAKQNALTQRIGTPKHDP